MTTFKIYANGMEMGEYHGATQSAAADAYAQAMGYMHMADLAFCLGKSEQAARAELTFEPVQ